MPHIHQAIDFVTTPVIVHPDRTKVLLVDHPKYGWWMHTGGHIELNETPDQALLREIAEECGLEVEVLSEKPDIAGAGYEPLWRPRFIDIHDANAPHRHISLVYYCLAKSADFVLSSEHTTMKWFTMEELESPQYKISELAGWYARNALEEMKT